MSRKQVPWAGWSKEAPTLHERTNMLKKCGRKCFLGNKTHFPICKKNTCKISRKGVYAAYVRAREYSSRGKKYTKIAERAKRILTRKKILR